MSSGERECLRRELAWLHRLFALAPDEREKHLTALARRDAGFSELLRGLLEDADALASEREEAESFLPSASQSTPLPVLGDRFRIVRKLGAGGMGEVYLASRSDDIAQLVAIKIVHIGAMSRAQRAARREQQILARLLHPNIAGLIDAGVADDGRAWFAMHYIEGERLADWCDRRKLTPQERARLFIDICRAVQYAHKNLILHRDIKPSNILVDTEGVPKLLDFGIAKVIDAEDPLDTRTLAMTPAYAAPEQLRGERATTASDVYQLGVVLYELVCGVAAHVARGFSADNVSLPRIHNAFAAFTSRNADKATDIAAARGSSPRKLSRGLKGDLGRIIRKATADHHLDRYDTAQSLADDLDRWLKGVPVVAHRGTLAYRFSRLVKRHALAAVALAVLALGLLVTSGLAINRAINEREQRVLAEHAQQRSDSVVRFMREVFHQTDPNVADPGNLSVAQMVEGAKTALARRTDLDSATRAALLAEIADAFLGIGKPERALEPAEQSTALLHAQSDRYPADYLQSANALMNVYFFLGRYKDATELIDSALPVAQKIAQGERHWHAFFLSQRSYSEAILNDFESAELNARAAVLELEKAGATDGSDYVDSLVSLEVVLSMRENFGGAVDVARRVLALFASGVGGLESSRMTAQINLGQDLYNLGETRQAAAVLRQAALQTEALVGSDHLGTVRAKTALLLSYLANGDLTDARALVPQLEEAARRSTYARSQTWIDEALIRYALAVGDFGAALARANHALETAQRTDAPVAWVSAFERLVGEARLQAGDTAGALATLRQSVQCKPVTQCKRLVLAAAQDSLGRALIASGDPDAALPPLRQAAEGYAAIQGAGQANALRARIHFDWALARHDANVFTDLEEQRARLVSLLGGDDKPQIWQLDILADDLARHLGRVPANPARRAHAETGLQQTAAADATPKYVGISEF